MYQFNKLFRRIQLFLVLQLQVRLVKPGKLAKRSAGLFFRPGSTIGLKSSPSLVTGISRLSAPTIDNLDKLLDELEGLARTDQNGPHFFNRLLEHARQTLSAQSATLLIPTNDEQWLPLASSGPCPPNVVGEVSARLQLAAVAGSRGSSNGVGLQLPETLTGTCDQATWLASPLQPNNFSKGCLLVVIPQQIPTHAQSGLGQVLQAFAEIVAARQQMELESFLDVTWDQVQGLCRQLMSAENREQSANLLVNGLVRLLGTARVSVFAASPLGRLPGVRSLAPPRLLAISGAPHAKLASHSVTALQRVAADVSLTGRPVLRQRSADATIAEVQHANAAVGGAHSHDSPSLNSDGVFANLIAVQLTPLQQGARGSQPAATLETSSARQQEPQSTRGRSPSASLLVIEYRSQAELMTSAGLLRQSLPTVAMAWEQQLRWLRLPRLLRTFGLAPLQFILALTPLVKWGMLAVLLALAVWGLQQPQTLVIEAEGTYEPANSRAVYASDDGFIEELLIDDGVRVTEGQPLVQLRSSTLELRHEQLTGEMRTVVEEASGIRIAINQLDADDPDALNQQSRLAGKIAELDTKQASLQQQLEMLQQQRARLLLTAPIAGSVVAKDLQRQLAGRPVRRGEALFTIVDQAGPWQVRLQVADRDSGYLLAYYAEPSIDTSPNPSMGSGQSSSSAVAHTISFAFASQPVERYTAGVTWISDEVENRHGEGCFVEVRAKVDTRLEIAHAGAGVHAFFPCGQQPLWFVWCRPLVETVQRSVWFRSLKNDE